MSSGPWEPGDVAPGWASHGTASLARAQLWAKPCRIRIRTSSCALLQVQVSCNDLTCLGKNPALGNGGRSRKDMHLHHNSSTLRKPFNRRVRSQTAVVEETIDPARQGVQGRLHLSLPNLPPWILTNTVLLLQPTNGLAYSHQKASFSSKFLR